MASLAGVSFKKLPLIFYPHMIICIFLYHPTVKEFLETAKEEFEEKWKSPNKVSTIEP